ncbi:MAG: PEP-CTERM sorting domain-containing protein [Phycisphaerales bacterium JB039]
MPRTSFVLGVAALAGLATSASAQVADLGFGGSSPVTVVSKGMSTSDNVLWDNGPLETEPGFSVLGPDDNILGYGHQLPSTNFVGDDFSVGAGGWQIDSFTFFAYQTGGDPTASSFTDVSMTVYAGPVGDTSSPVASYSGLASSTFTGIFRSSDTSPRGTNRPIYANEVLTPGLSLSAGDYWVAWASAGSLTSGPWAPPVTPFVSDGNAVQSIGGGDFVPVTQASGHPDELPFVIQGVPTPGALALFGLGGLAAIRRRR